MVNRRVTRFVLNTSEVTDKLVSANGADYVLALQTTDALYLGYTGPFASRYFQVGVANSVVSTISIQYWNGTSFEDVDDVVDQTSSGGIAFAQSGFISWVNKGDWKARSLPGIDLDVELFWVKLSVSVNLSGTTALKSVLNVFSDDTILRAYFPELVSDSNYLPSGKTNFLDQHIAAKDLIVLRLKQRKLIQSESQIIDPNDVAIASVYAAAMLILQPIATSPDSQALLESARKGFDSEISKVTFAVDVDGDGIVDDSERMQSFSVGVFRR